MSNLPYNIATPIVSNLLVHPELCPVLLVVTIQLDLAERMRAEIGDLVWFHQVVRSVFLRRRKNLRRVIHGLWRDRLTRPEVDALLESIGLTVLVRAEAMNYEEFVSLAQALEERLKAAGDARPAVDGEADDAEE